MKLEYYLIDAAAPFHSVECSNEEINWSKIPFENLEKEDNLDEEKCRQIEKTFSTYVKKVASLGYNAVSLDDLAHLVPHSFYPGKLNSKIHRYRIFYTRLITLARKAGCRVFVTTDILFKNRAITDHIGRSEQRAIRFLGRSFSKLFRSFPAVSGVIVRFGESDGIDVTGDFRSEIVIKSVASCRRYLRSLLQICDQFERQLIVRTWTLGAFKIGDLMWNAGTFRSVFSHLNSDNLIISQKYGETDFFRYQTMSPVLFEGQHRKIVEFQARREYEGFGEFPSFTGFDYERYGRYLSGCPTLAGISVWCQTGGWSHFNKIIYGNNSSLWVELNVHVTIKVFRDGMSAEEAVENFIKKEQLPFDTGEFLRFLRLSEKAVKQLWYIPEFAVKRIYFRRTRVPPLLYVFWDTIIINHTMRKVIRRFVHERREAIHDGYRALHKIKEMKKIAGKLGFETDDLTFQYATFKILAVAREYYFGPWDEDVARRLTELVNDYRKRYPRGFHIILDFNPVHLKKWLIKTIFRFSLRMHPHYRFLDMFILLRFASLIYPLFRIWEKRRMPSFTRSQAMGIEVLFK